MPRLILSRLLQLPVILGVIFAVTLVLTWLLPGNPLQRAEGPRLPPEVLRAVERQYAMDSPWAFAGQYVRGLVAGSELHGWPDLGPSLIYRDQRVIDLLGQGLRTSVPLGFAGVGIALVVGTLAGLAGAWRPGSAVDGVALGVALVGVSLPNFVTGAVLLVVFGGWLGWLPVGGLQTPLHAVLPAVTLSVIPAAYIARLVRLGLAEVMSSDYVRTARAKGLSRERALLKHALRVALLPVLSFLGPATAAAMTGSFVVEEVFSLPGMGRYFVEAVLAKDQFLIMGTVLTYSTLLVLLNLAVDVLYAVVDPRIRGAG